ncbi:cupin domain-containing protein [Streptomyces sp. NPDC059063]|uniref:(R)-mandelonitrile lyase n=1 Tax=unclassified Streptomyces TaxID=2593676 RepID=UPI0036D11023
MHITRTRPDSRRGPAEHFTGTVWLDEIASPEPPSRLRMFSVHFTPGARTAWHRHPHGQVLHVTEGEGLVQREGGPVEPIRAGDTVWIEPGERHWHGAGPRTFMTHLAVVEAAEDGTTAHWDELVTDTTYSA